MKIKLSRGQWEMVGRKAGWMKKADNINVADESDESDESDELENPMGEFEQESPWATDLLIRRKELVKEMNEIKRQIEASGRSLDDVTKSLLNGTIDELGLEYLNVTREIYGIEEDLKLKHVNVETVLPKPATKLPSKNKNMSNPFGFPPIGLS